MKNIELTEEHKVELLEMCKVLFPEYVIYLADDDGFIEGEQWVGDQNMGEDRPVNEFNIHWFEFCMTYLINKLELEYTSIIVLTENHPVDYLYEEFKKL
jgi:hypothetical protein